MHDIISIGSAVRDIFVLSKDLEIVKDPHHKGGLAERIPLGSKIDIDEMFVTTGGGATNSAATFANFGLSTGIIARLGHDEDGDLILEDLQARGIDTKLCVKDSKDNTGLSILLTAPGGERTILVYRGVSGAFTEKDIPTSKLKTRALYVSSLGGDAATLEKIASYCEKKAIFLAWNPGNKELALPKAQLRHMLTAADILLVNKEEATVLAGGKPEHLSVIGLARKLLRHEHQIVIVTDGTKGTHAASKAESWFVGTRTVKSISRTGAGDAFGSATVAALLKGTSLIDALRIGTLNAESVIQSYGAKQGLLTSFPTPSELDKIPYKKL